MSTEPIIPVSEQLAHTESREARTQRISTGVLIGVMGLLLGYLVFATQGVARFGQA